MKIRVLVGVLSALALTAMLAGCGAKTQETTPETTAAVETEAMQTETAATEYVPETVPADCVVVKTPYGNLQYQDQWYEFMLVEQVQDGENLTVTFVANFENGQYPLFALIIGTLEDVEPAAQITDAGGVKRNVYVRMLEIEESGVLTDTEQNRVYAMQEDINYVIENIA